MLREPQPERKLINKDQTPSVRPEPCRRTPTVLQRPASFLSGIFYGWRMVGLVSAIRIVGGGLHQFGFTVFFLPISRDLGLSRAPTSLAFSLSRAEGALEAPLVGYLIDRYGPRPILVTAVFLAGVGYILVSWVDSYASFLIVYLGVICLAFVAGFVHSPMVVANNWGSSASGPAP